MKSILKKITGIIVSIFLTFGMLCCSNGSGGSDSPSSDKATVATPTFSIASGKVYEGTKVKITCGTEGAKIFYTTDGSVPTASSIEYTTEISITSAITIKAIALKAEMNDSAVATVSYTIKEPEKIPEGFEKIIKGNTGNFYIAKTELTYTEWYAVYQWAVNNGYIFHNLGREGNSGTDGAVPTENSKQPVTNISWRDAVVWCNAASEKAGLVPVYEYQGSVLKEAENYSSSGTNTANTTDVENSKADNLTVKAEANGYRLPTVEEWRVAAKAGATYPFSGSNNINEVAWWSENSENKTHDVGTKTANDYGLYDMSGNVWEWCQNLWSGGGTYRSYCGGGYDQPQYVCNISMDSSISYYFSYTNDKNRGFRVVRSANY